MLFDAGKVEAVPKKDERGAIVIEVFKVDVDLMEGKLQSENIYSSTSETIQRKIELFVIYEYN